MRECSAPLPSISHRSIVTSTLALLVLLVGTQAWACSVPVFRYALEHWRSDPYQVIFFHRGELTPDQESLLNRLSKSGRAGEISANVEVIPVDLETASSDDPQTKDDLALWKQQNTDKLPWMVVRYPLSVPNPNIVWAGEPTKESIDGLLDSPKRREMAQRILKGNTAVWLFLESGKKEADDLAYQRLNNELKRCEKELQLPPPDPQDVADGLISVDQASLKIQFSILRLTRDDPKELQLINMLLDSEQGLRDEEFKDQPMTFPIFGRGRALYAVIGKGISREVIFDACQFLVGPCSCQVKNQNPGTDLMMAVNWEQQVVPQIAIDQSLPPLPVIEKVSTESDVKPAPESQTLPKKTKAKADSGNAPETPVAETAAAATKDLSADTETTGFPVLMTVFICLGVAVVGIAGASFFVMKS